MPDIDNHHRRLVELANNVLDADYRKDVEVFREALKFLSGYVQYHFAAEEHLMKVSGYGGLDRHRRWHDEFRRNIEEFVVTGYREGFTKELGVRISFAVENWLLEHIRISDRDLVRFIQSQQSRTPVRLPEIHVLKSTGAIPKDFDERMLLAG
jgi:hemerythrin